MTADLWEQRETWRKRALDAEEAIRQLAGFMRVELDPTFDGPTTDYVIGARTKSAVRQALRNPRRKRP